MDTLADIPESIYTVVQNSKKGHIWQKLTAVSNICIACSSVEIVFPQFLAGYTTSQIKNSITVCVVARCGHLIKFWPEAINGRELWRAMLSLPHQQAYDTEMARHLGLWGQRQRPRYGVARQRNWGCLSYRTARTPWTACGIL